MQLLDIDYNYIIRVRDYMRIVQTPLILVSSGEDGELQRPSKKRP